MTTAKFLRGRLQNTPGVVGASIILRSGNYFDYLEPTPTMIHVDDVAWGLAHTCRFGGQIPMFYSVAQHCVLVSQACPSEDRFAGLLHDAAEAYVGDVVGPLKQLCPDFKAIERRVEAVVALRFGLTLPWPCSVKHADLRLLRTEQRDLTTGPEDQWNGLHAYTPLAERIVPLPPLQAAELWLQEFYRLGGK